MVPLIAGMIWMLGLMTITGWKINFINIVVLPVVFGYGISTGIHLYHRFQESGSIAVSLSRTGKAVVGSSITTFIGWGALLVSGHPGLESMGILACFGILADLFVSFTVMPSMIQLTNNKNYNNGQKE
jgi:predicted RND superfamily exporter protein